MAIDINTIITNFKTLYPANTNQIWSVLKQDNPSLTDEIIEQLDIEFTDQTITITVKPSSTDYEGSVYINSYQYNLRVNIDNVEYYVYNFNQFCSSSGTFNVKTNLGDKTFTTNSEFTVLEFIENPSINYIADHFLYNCSNINIQSLGIPNGVNSVGWYFLRGCSSFNQPLTLPNSLVAIGNDFLRGCSSFNQPLTLPNTIRTIGEDFLCGCSSFNQPLTLPNSVTRIPNDFLISCSNFNQELTLPNSLVSIDGQFLNYCINFNSPLTLPNTIRTIGHNFMTSCQKFNQQLILPTSLTSIGNNFLAICWQFNQPLTIPNSVITIGDKFLSPHINGVTYPINFNSSLTLSNSLTSIGDDFLNSCEIFNQELTLPNSLVSIGNNFLYNCKSFNQPLTLPNSLTSIGNRFLYYCVKFNKDLKLTDNITNIGWAFMFQCNNFDSILRISSNITPVMFSNETPSGIKYTSFMTNSNYSVVYTNGFKIKYNKFDQLLERFPNSDVGPYYRHLVNLSSQTTFIAKETSLSYKYHLNFVLGEHDIKVYLVKENEVTMKFDKPITTILPDTSTGKLLIGNALKNLPKEQLTETALETKITAINFYNK